LLLYESNTIQWKFICFYVFLLPKLALLPEENFGAVALSQKVKAQRILLLGICTAEEWKKRESNNRYELERSHTMLCHAFPSFFALAWPHSLSHFHFTRSCESCLNLKRFCVEYYASSTGKFNPSRQMEAWRSRSRSRAQKHKLN